jgi:hypothetical protein
MMLVSVSEVRTPTERPGKLFPAYLALQAQHAQLVAEQAQRDSVANERIHAANDEIAKLRGDLQVRSSSVGGSGQPNKGIGGATGRARGALKTGGGE